MDNKRFDHTQYNIISVGDQLTLLIEWIPIGGIFKFNSSFSDTDLIGEECRVVDYETIIYMADGEKLDNPIRCIKVDYSGKTITLHPSFLEPTKGEIREKIFRNLGI